MACSPADPASRKVCCCWTQSASCPRSTALPMLCSLADHSNRLVVTIHWNRRFLRKCRCLVLQWKTSVTSQPGSLSAEQLLRFAPERNWVRRGPHCLPTRKSESKWGVPHSKLSKKTAE